MESNYHDFISKAMKCLPKSIDTHERMKVAVELYKSCIDESAKIIRYRRKQSLDSNTPCKISSRKVSIAFDE